MNVYSPNARYTLGQGELLAIRQGRGQRLRCTAGEVLISQPTHLEDVHLRAGAEFVVSSNGLVLIESFRTAVIDLPPARRPLRKKYWRTLALLLAALGVGVGPHQLPNSHADLPPPTIVSPRSELTCSLPGELERWHANQRQLSPEGHGVRSLIISERLKHIAALGCL